MLTLYDIINLPVEDILKKTNKNRPIPSVQEEYLDKNVKLKQNFSLKNYKGLLQEQDIFVGKKFYLLNNLEVEIVEVNEDKNFVLVRSCIFKYVEHKLRLNKLIKNEETEGFPKKGEKFYYVNKYGEKKLITIKFISVSQKSVGFLDNGKKVYVKISKLVPEK